jgi:hypothetical protein
MRLVNFRERGAVELSERLVSEGFHPRAAVRAVRRLQELVRYLCVLLGGCMFVAVFSYACHRKPCSSLPPTF